MAWTGKEENRKALAALRVRMIDTARQVVQRGSLVLQTEQQLHASGRPGPNVQTGDLRRGIGTLDVEQQAEGVFQGGTKATTNYSRIQERGGVIYPKRGMFLVWTDGPRPSSPEGWRQAQREGRVHRARIVRIPARPFMAPGVRTATPKYRDLSARMFATAIRGG